MPSRLLVPRIRVDLLDSSPCKSSLPSLPPSSTFDIRDISGSAKLLPDLLAEDFVFDNADDALYFEDGRLRNFPPFPLGRQPPLFILISHRARLPFSTCQDAFDPGEFFRDEEDARPLLTAPTVPRMKRIMREQLYMQKWVDTLTLDSPPKHIPWACEKPATNKKWTSETEQRRAIQEPPLTTHTNRFSAPAGKVPRAQGLCSFSLSKSSGSLLASTESHTSIIRPKSPDVHSDILRSESKTPHNPHRIVRTSQTHSSSTLFSSGSGMTPSTPDVPLAARRGKPLSGLKLNGCVIEHLEYPDIPTAFRGSPVIWSPRFDTFPAPSFTDHERMLLDLRSKCASLGSGVSVYIQEPQHPQTEPSRTPPNVDEWAFTQGLTSFDNNFLGPMGNQILKEIVADTSAFLSEDPSTPAKSTSFTARLGLVPRLQSTPTSQSRGNCCSDPPGLPLPPRPALVNPSTPPHVRGILKKVKSVRFEDMTLIGPENHTLPAVPPRASSEHLSPLPCVASSKRSCTPKLNTAGSSCPASVKEAFGRNIQKPAPRSRLPPGRAKAKENLEPAPPNVGNAREGSKPTSSIELSCRIAHVRENTSPDAIPRVQSDQKGLSIIEADVRRGIEGTTKSRLSTPLRNIFRFR